MADLYDDSTARDNLSQGKAEEPRNTIIEKITHPCIEAPTRYGFDIR